jgi:predicted Rossmann fold nucleotide-binding protein DprA/Smf involved in DNA uptake
MIIAVTGIRELDNASFLDVELATLDAASAADVMRFGGADGSDTVALKSAHGRTCCEVIVPALVINQPAEARTAIQTCADVVVELKHRLFPRPEAYYARNRRLVDGADRLLAFTDGQMRGGTYWTIRYASTRNVPIDLVQVKRRTVLR